MTVVFQSANELLKSVGQKFGPTEWFQIEQSRVDAFASATEDHQWIHIDTERARAGPFGSTIAHGYLTLSLTNYFLPQLMRISFTNLGVNYGLDRVRFTAPVLVGGRVRGRGEVISANSVSSGVQVIVRVTVEIEGGDHPACVADTISRFILTSE